MTDGWSKSRVREKRGNREGIKGNREENKMVFAVTYRGRDGALRTEAIEADGRGECFAQCKARGFVPIKVEAGASMRGLKGGESGQSRANGRPIIGENGKDDTSPKAGGSTSGRRNLFYLFVAIAAIAAIAWWWLGGRGATALPEKPPEAKPKATKPSETRPVKPQVVEEPRLKRHRKPKTVPIATADVGTPPDLPMFIEAPRLYGEINGSNIWPRALFKTREENMVAGLLSAKPGSRIVLNGFLPGEEERLLASLDIPVEFEEIDTPQERAMKEYMIKVKEELKEAVANGEKITDIIQALRDELNSQANYRDKLRQAHNMLMKEGTPQEAEEFRQEANKMLSEYGMDPIVIRSTQRARLGLDQ